MVELGKLSIVSTPIGNLEDITLRALRILREADLIAAEDTRVTAVLLDRNGIRRPLVSVHEHNEASRIAEIVAAIREGKNVALVTDAGTPVVSDPGYRVIRAVHEASLPVEVIPGPSAITAAVALSGLPAEAFAFVGFPPRKNTERERWARRVLALPTAVVFFESPHRLVATLDTLAEAAPSREAAVTRELTKIHEECVRGTLASLTKEFAARERILGEVTVVIAIPGSARAVEKTVEEGEDAAAEGPTDESTMLVEDGADDERTAPSGDDEPASALADIPDEEERTIDVEGEIARLKQSGLKDKDVAKEIAKLTGRTAREIYAELIDRKK